MSMNVFKYCISVIPTFVFVGSIIHITDWYFKLGLVEIYTLFYAISLLLLIIASICGWRELINKDCYHKDMIK